METAILIFSAFSAAVLSGVFGMAGGLVLLAVYLALLPVPKVMMLHGLVMLVANVGRATIHRRHLLPSVVVTGVCMAPILGALFIYQKIVLPKELIYILVGLTSLIVWMPKSSFKFPMNRKRMAALPAGLSFSFTLSLGAAGPIIDALFLQSGLTRQQIMANKAFLQVLAHLSKVIVFGGLTLLLSQQGVWGISNTYTPVLLLGSLAASLVGTWVGVRILNRMSDEFFRASSRYLITAISAYYIVVGIIRFFD